MADVENDSEMSLTEFAFDESLDIPAGSTVYLYDENGRSHETAVVNRQGQFEFQRLATGAVYKIELEKGTLDVSARMFMMTDGEEHEVSGNILKGALFRKLEGQLIELDPNSEEGRYAYAKLRGEAVNIDGTLAADADGLNEYGFEYGQLPPEGTKVTLIDADGNVVEEAFTDGAGIFNFKKLDPDKNYSMSLDESMDFDGDLNMYLVDGDGLKVPVAKGLAGGAEFAGDLANPTEAAEDEDLFMFNYAALPPAGSKVYLTDENDNVIDSSYVDAEGNFKFKKLKSDKSYLMRLGDDDNRNFDYQISDGSGKLFKLSTENNKGDVVSAVDGSVLITPAEYDKFAFDFENLPKDGSKIYLTDENGNITDSSFVDANGNFRFNKLDPTQTYLFIVEDEDFDMNNADLYSMNDGQARKLTKLPSSFQMNQLALMDVADSKFDASKFQLNYEGNIPDSAQAYLYDEETKEIVEAVEIDEQGNFSFRTLDPDRKYSIKFDREIDETQAKFFAIEEPDAQLDIASIVAADKEKLEEKAIAIAAEKKAQEEAAKKSQELSQLSDNAKVVYFDFNGYLLNDSQVEYLKKEVIGPLMANPDMKLSVDGHADNIGSDDVNKRMSNLRLSSILYHLKIRGIDETRVTLTPYGESKPIESNDTEEGRTKNRRVEIHTIQ
jgi:outer membrane protein OmpA-like peptidoglycan-associated protein